MTPRPLWALLAFVVSGSCQKPLATSSRSLASPMAMLRPTNGLPLLSHGFFEFAAAAGYPLGRSKDAPTCPTILVSQGYDWIPQYPILFTLERSEVAGAGCTVKRSGLPPWTPAPVSPAYFTDVIAADLDGDGKDEFVLGALADQTHRLGFGFVEVVRHDGTEWVTKKIAKGISPTKIEVADLNGDGVLDVVLAAPIGDGQACPKRSSGCPPNVGVNDRGIVDALNERPTSPARGPIPFLGLGAVDESFGLKSLAPFVRGVQGGRDVTAMGRCPMDGLSAVLIGRGGLEFERVDLPEVVGAFDVRAGDLDFDGDVDLLFSGKLLMWLSQGQASRSPADWSKQVVAVPESKEMIFSDLDLVHSAEMGRIVFGVSMSCWSQCADAGKSGVQLWQVLPRIDDDAPEFEKLGHYSLNGLTGALSLGEISAPAGIDLLYGGLTTCHAGCCRPCESCTSKCDICMPPVGCIGSQLHFASQVVDGRGTSAVARLIYEGRELRPMFHDIEPIFDPLCDSSLSKICAATSATHTVELGAGKQYFVLPGRRPWIDLTVSVTEGPAPRTSFVRGRNILYVADANTPKKRQLRVNGTTAAQSDWFITSGSYFGLDSVGASVYIDDLNVGGD